MTIAPRAEDIYRTPRSGQVWTDNPTETTQPTRTWITRVARDGSWADIDVRQHNGARWGRRMRTPLPESWAGLR